MYEIISKLSVEDMAKLLFNTEEGLKAVKEELHKTDAGDYYDSFIEGVNDIICYLFTHFHRDEN